MSDLFEDLTKSERRLLPAICRLDETLLMYTQVGSALNLHFRLVSHMETSLSTRARDMFEANLPKRLTLVCAMQCPPSQIS